VLIIRRFQSADWSALWPVLRATFKAGDTYAFAVDSTEAEICRAWVETPAATFVACAPDGQLLGSYFIKPNQPGLGAHVCNCGYVVAPHAQGQGTASRMCQHSQREAVDMGFRAMQFNLVVSTNQRAIDLWQRLGFAIIGTLPHAFNHQRFGFVDALIMFKSLVDRDITVDLAAPAANTPR
jgi:ribosomal protein S18 acetylase RimI-like enzyme